MAPVDDTGAVAGVDYQRVFTEAWLMISGLILAGWLLLAVMVRRKLRTWL